MDRERDSELVLQAMLEEYRALYSLLVFRLGAMEQRIPATGALLSAALCCTAVLPPSALPMVFLALPLVLIWFVRSTLGHARSKQDVKLRLDQIERRVNQLVGEPVLTFQSRHPSRGRVVAGRSGRELVMSVYLASLGLLGACVAMLPNEAIIWTNWELYALYTATCGLWMSVDVIRLGRYRGGRQLLSGREEP